MYKGKYSVVQLEVPSSKIYLYVDLIGIKHFLEKQRRRKPEISSLTQSHPCVTDGMNKIYHAVFWIYLILKQTD
jgi:hypothetical protein